MPFTPFPKIKSFGDVWRDNHDASAPLVHYRAKVKLNGVLAAIRCEGGEVYAQDSASDITVDSDNAGFAGWLEDKKQGWVIDPAAFEETFVFFGEWAGPGVREGDAVSNIATKCFFIFAVQYGDRMVIDPDEIEALLPDDRDSALLDDVMVLPWTNSIIEIDFAEVGGSDGHAVAMSYIAENIGKRDSFIANTFEVEGPGEGFVMVPVPLDGHTLSRNEYAAFTFSVKASRTSADAPEAAAGSPESIASLMAALVTEDRCQEALDEACDGIAEKLRAPDFLRWVVTDIRETEGTLIKDSGLTWEQVLPLVNAAAIMWFYMRCSMVLGRPIT